MVAIRYFLLALCAAAEARKHRNNGFNDKYCGKQRHAETKTGIHCCPGGVVTQDNKTLCCVGGRCAKSKLLGCKEDIDTCKSTFDVDDPNYANNVKDATGLTVKKPKTSGSSMTEVDLAMAGAMAVVAALPAAGAFY